MKGTQLCIASVVALLTAGTIGLLTGHGAFADGDREENKKPVIVVESVEVVATFESTPVAGSRPVLLLRVRNTLASPISIPLTLSLHRTSPVEMISRAMPLTPKKPVWSRNIRVKLAAHRPGSIRVPIDHLVEAPKRKGLGMQYSLVLAKRKEAAQTKTAPPTGRAVPFNSSVQIAAFSIEAREGAGK